jgi:cadmium resistance protein CadD (predicted permease)
MKSQRTTAAPVKDTPPARTISLFDKQNLIWMLGGVAIMIIGFLLMAGGRSDNPAVFEANEVYSARRITVAPIVILIGLVVLIVAIFRQPKNH